MFPEVFKKPNEVHVIGKERNTGLEPIIFIDYQFEYSFTFFKTVINLSKMTAMV